MVDVGRGMWQLLLSSNAMHKQLVELWWISFRASGMEQWSWHLTMNLFWLQVPIFANQCEPRMSLRHISVQTGWCGDKARTSIAERFVQSVRGIQKTLLCHIEDELKVAIPDGHPVIQWAAMHVAWLYNRYQVRATMKVTPFQSLRGRPYHGKLASFGQTVFGLDSKATKFKPAWKKGGWLGKDTSGMDTSRSSLHLHLQLFR